MINVRNIPWCWGCIKIGKIERKLLIDPISQNDRRSTGNGDSRIRRRPGSRIRENDREIAENPVGIDKTQLIIDTRPARDRKSSWRDRSKLYRAGHIVIRNAGLTSLIITNPLAGKSPGQGVSDDVKIYCAHISTYRRACCGRNGDRQHVTLRRI